MARDRDFVDKLQGFTNSLEGLVEMLQEQVKTNPSEVLNKLVESFDMIKTIAEDVKQIKQDVKVITNNTEKTLNVVKGIKDSKETVMFGEMENKTSKDKINGAVKTVILIAAGVLAIGMAFKIVGDVDFTSVVALGMGIMFSAHAFATVASIKDDDGKSIDFKRALLVSTIMTIISASLLVSAYLLQFVPTITPMTSLSIVVIGISLGLSAFFILKAVGKLKPKELAMVALAPLILPIISGAIVLSAMVLKNMPVGITNEQVKT